MRVNGRESIVRHDYRVLAEAAGRLFEPAVSPVSVDEAAFELLRSVWGLDQEVDELLESPESVHLAQAWKAPIHRLLVQLEGQLEKMQGNASERRDQ